MIIRYKEDECHAEWIYIRSFVLAYIHISVLEQLKRFPIKNILRICTDAIYTTEIPESVADTIVSDISKIKYGQWREKPSGYIYREEAASWNIKFKGILDFPPSEMPALLPNETPGFAPIKISDTLESMTNMQIYIWGQGGCGKTTTQIRIHQNRKLTILGPMNQHGVEIREKYPEINAMTYHKFFHLGAISIEDWNHVCLDDKPLGKVVI